MKILSNAAYRDLLSQIKQGEDYMRSSLTVKKELENEIEQCQKDNATLLSENISLRAEANSLDERLQKTILERDNIQATKDNLLKKLNELSGRVSGYKKRVNQLTVLLKETNGKIENYKDELKKSHQQLTPSQYSKRLKPIHKKNS